jgi:hypothetical protein
MLSDTDVSTLLKVDKTKREFKAFYDLSTKWAKMAAALFKKLPVDNLSTTRP